MNNSIDYDKCLQLSLIISSDNLKINIIDNLSYIENNLHNDLVDTFDLVQKNIFYKMLFVNSFACLEGVIRGAVLTINSHCRISDCYVKGCIKECKYYRFEDEILKMTFNDLVDYLFNVRFDPFSSYKRDELNNIKDIRNQIHLSSEQLDRKGENFNAQHVENILDWIFVVTDWLATNIDLLKDCNDCIKILDEDNYDKERTSKEEQKKEQSLYLVYDILFKMLSDDRNITKKELVILRKLINMIPSLWNDRLANMLVKSIAYSHWLWRIENVKCYLDNYYKRLSYAANEVKNTDRFLKLVEHIRTTMINKFNGEMQEGYSVPLYLNK